MPVLQFLQASVLFPVFLAQLSVRIRNAGLNGCKGFVDVECKLSCRIHCYRTYQWYFDWCREMKAKGPELIIDLKIEIILPYSVLHIFWLPKMRP